MKDFTLPNYSNGRFVAIAGAAFVHLSLGAFAMLPSQEILPKEQFIQVSLAHPSQNTVQQQKDSALKITNDFIAVKNNSGSVKKSAVKKVSDGESSEGKQLNKIAEEEKTSPKSSGQVDKNALANNGAYTKPQFEAPSLQNGAPQYPEYARRNGMQGKVMLEVQVTKEGSAKEVAIVSSSGYDTLDQAAFEAVKNWHFIPARLNGKVVDTPMPVLVPIIFSFS